MSSFCSYSHFFSKKFQHICVSLNVNFNKLLTDSIVSFEQLGPGLHCMIVVQCFFNRHFQLGKFMVKFKARYHTPISCPNIWSNYGKK